MVTDDCNDPYSGFNFILEIDGVDAAGFLECRGLTAEADIVEYRNDCKDIIVRKLPGLKKSTNITLKHGFTRSEDL